MTLSNRTVSTQAVKFRFASMEDIAAISTLLIQAYKQTYVRVSYLFPDSTLKMIFGKSYRDTVLPTQLNCEKHEITLCEVNTKLAGLVKVEFRDDYTYLDKIYLLNEYHGNGYGQHLLALCKQSAADHGYNKIKLYVWGQNEKAVRFYQHHQFKRGNVVPFYILNEPTSESAIEMNYKSSFSLINMQICFPKVNVRFRFATIGDIPSISTFMMSVYKQTYAAKLTHYPEDDIETLFGKSFRENTLPNELQYIHNKYILCESNTDLAGLAKLEFNDNVTNLDKLYFLNAFQGKGYGQAMINFCYQLAHIHGYKKMELSVSLDNTKAISFFKRVGFIEGNTVPFLLFDTKPVKASKLEMHCDDITLYIDSPQAKHH